MRITLWLVTIILLFILAVSGPLAAKQDDDFESLKRFSQTLDIVEGAYVKNISRSELIEDSIKGMLEQLDPHSAYLNADEMKAMQETTSGEFTGIGIEISMDNGRLIVVSPIEDTPAYKAGLQAGDFILEIDGESTDSISLIDAVDKIRGTKGSSVELAILHKDAKAPLTVKIVRGVIPITSVKTEILGDGQLYVRITRFNENTTRDLHQALSDYLIKNSLNGVVLDLRNNPGGLLDQAVTVADTFLDSGVVTYIQGRDPQNRRDFFASSQSTDINVPMVALINAGSASASEIVAGALQDRHRALLVGEPSFGKGSVQQIIPLSDGAGLKLTTALYYTPSGRSIQAQGIQPDMVIPFERPTQDQEDGRSGFTLHEKDLSGHLENQNGTSSSQKTNLIDKAQKMLSKDNQLRMALELVKNLPKFKKIQ